MRTHGKEKERSFSMNAKKIPLAILGSAAGFFAVTFTIYFFHIDMKFLSRFVEPILLRHYDKIPRKQYV